MYYIYVYIYVWKVYVSMLLSTYIPPSLSSPPSVSISLFSMSVSLLLLCKLVH